MKFLSLILLAISLSSCALMKSEESYREEHFAAMAKRTPEEIKIDNMKAECVAQANYGVGVAAQTAILRGCMQTKGL